VPEEPAPIDPLAVLEVLERHRVEYVLIGGVAANVHGYPLPTEDVDITPATDARNLARLADALSELGARLRTGTGSAVDFPVDAAMLASAEIWTLSTDRGDLDIVLRPDGTAGYPDLRRDASFEQLSDSLQVRVASLADVIRSKEAANRAKDQAALPALRQTLELLRGLPG
jgi:hypothetical protein